MVQGRSRNVSGRGGRGVSEGENRARATKAGDGKEGKREGKGGGKGKRKVG